MQIKNNLKLIKILIIAAIGALIWFSPSPKDLDPKAWQYFAIYIMAVLGIMLRPFKEPAITLIILGLFSLITGPKFALAGFSSTAVWLVFTAFLISAAFAETGLGRRIAYLLIGKFGKSTLGICYSMAITDLIIAPATPSNTARSGGIIFPIFNNVAATLGSKSEDGTSRKMASFFAITAWHISLTTSALFFTATSVNPITAGFAKDILSINLDWVTWIKGSIVPGMIVFCLTPYLLYKLYPPEVKKIDSHKEISAEGLKELGPMSIKEKWLTAFFALAIIAWATGSITGIDATAVALAFLSLCLLAGVISWDNILKQSGAWNTLIWYAAILGISGALAEAGFFKWLSEVISSTFNFTDANQIGLLLVLVIVGILLRYLIASAASFCTTILPVLLTIGLVAGLPPMPLALMIGFSADFGSMVTHYGGALGPVIFAYDHVDQKTWWLLGLATIALNIIVYFTIGIPYWNMIGL